MATGPVQACKSLLVHPADQLSTADVVSAAKRLLGAELITKVGGLTTSLKITEVEAYGAPEDRASHAFNHKRTKRTEVFYEQPGTAYVYLCYGIHEMFNVVTGPAGTPHAVLVRAGQPVQGLVEIQRRRNQTRLSPKLGAGPGVVTKALGIGRRYNGANLFAPEGEIQLVLSPDPVPDSEIIATPRIGIDYAGEPWVSKPWRFYLQGTKFVSQLRAFKV